MSIILILKFVINNSYLLICCNQLYFYICKLSIFFVCLLYYLSYKFEFIVNLVNFLTVHKKIVIIMVETSLSTNYEVYSKS